MWALEWNGMLVLVRQEHSQTRLRLQSSLAPKLASIIDHVALAFPNKSHTHKYIAPHSLAPLSRPAPHSLPPHRPLGAPCFLVHPRGWAAWLGAALDSSSRGSYLLAPQPKATAPAASTPPAARGAHHLLLHVRPLRKSSREKVPRSHAQDS